MPKIPDTITIPGQPEKFINFHKALEDNDGFLGSFNKMSQAAKRWSNECRCGKVLCKRTGLQHIFLNRAYWTTQTWINDYLDRLSRNA